jgi:hypothetical protein
MQTFISGPLPENARNLMRRLGYGEHIGRGGQTSFSRRLSGGDFPRFHAYVEERQGGLQVNLHLDQKPANLGSGAAHGGEYEGTLVAQEMQRIASQTRVMGKPANMGQRYPIESTKPKKGFWGSLFG